MLDLIIRGGDVVTPQGVGDFDVAISGENIAARFPSFNQRVVGVRRVILAADAENSRRTGRCLPSRRSTPTMRTLSRPMKWGREPMGILRS